ncbi:exodeoxyribonuclease VII large subunit [Candidatus Nitrosoglobus terrae]|uniref:Exodeoxyribonuclease 7 large subunit n=1 Tax=Candidatus Nitrosoglobus terrae TaxID=1630141 RepID=A0A1Q2SPL1_9GAMM|nr:exodeoxyribonuclease VII large subunit [Candidatus Nitrosoglobus terrae]BAW81074.1 exodeoxyribonuclease VII large subunit [Candidatus Nitrosoglobus terrae]
MDKHANSLQSKQNIYSISRLIHEARGILEQSFPLLWVAGEISNLSQPSSGHLYFTLKDKTAQVRCAMFRNRNHRLGFILANGIQVLACAQVSLYEARGEFQLIIESLEEAGDGALRRAFEALKYRLAAEGLFALEHKQPLPTLPQRIGVITSPSGAAICDILSVLKRRFPAIPVLIYPVPVQGEGAAQQIAAAISKADQRRDCDLLILARGGGSLEDLWAFNEAVLAYAIYHCTLPIICGVGHEIDFTIADLVADQRAPTPSAAAEMAVPDSREWYQRFAQLKQRLHLLCQQYLHYQNQQVKNLTARLRHPHSQQQALAQRVDELELRLNRAYITLNKERNMHLNHLIPRLKALSPPQQLKAYRLRLIELAQRLRNAKQRYLAQQQRRLEVAQRALQGISPLATLERGYAIVTGSTGIVRVAHQLQLGENIEVQFASSRIQGKVTKI